MATFIYTASLGSELTEEPRILSNRYGDGYVQEAGDGINTIRRVWNVIFNNRTLVDAAAILDFLRDHDGRIAFTWVDPNGETGRWVCPSWNGGAPTSGQLRTVTAKFEERFGV